MPTVKDFMDNNDNVRIKIDLTPDMDNIGICNENLYDGMLHDIPEHLQNLKVVQEGWLIGAACNSLTVIKEKEYSFEIREQLSRIVSVKAGSEKEAHKKIEDMYYSGEIVLNAEDLKEHDIRRYHAGRIQSKYHDLER